MGELTVKLLGMSLHGAALILLTALLRRVLLRWLPKGMLRLLWLPALLALLTPLPALFTLDLPLPEIRREEARMEELEGDRLDWDSWAAAPPSPEPERADETPETARSVPVMSLVWLGGAAALGLGLGILYIREYLRLGRSRPLESGAAADWLAEHPLRRRLSLRVLPGLRAPMTYGVLRPAILLPGAPDSFHGALLLALEHEYMHVRRLDAAWKLLLSLVLVLHWFDPAVWILYVLMNRDMELGCDEAVLLRLGGERRTEFARMLVSAGARGRLSPFPGLGAGVLRERVGSIMRFRRAGKTRRCLALLSFLVLVLCALGSLQARASGEGTYVSGDMVITVPPELKDLLLVETPAPTGEGEEVLFRVLERESWEAARELFPDSRREYGLLLTVSRMDEATAGRRLRQPDVAWDLLARDDKGYFYLAKRTTVEANMLTSPDTEDQSARWERRKLVNAWVRDLRSYLSWRDDLRTRYPAYSARLSAYFGGSVYSGLTRYRMNGDEGNYSLTGYPAGEDYAARITWETAAVSARSSELPQGEPIVITRPTRDLALMFWEGSDLVLLYSDVGARDDVRYCYTVSLLDSPGEKVGDLVKAWYEAARAAGAEWGA